MATSLPQIGAPPPSPPTVTNQFGPVGAAAAALRDRLAARPGATVAETQQANPQGALMAQAEAIKRVLDQMAKQSPQFAPFANRMNEIMQAGLEASLQTTGAVAGQPGRVSPPPTAEAAGGGGFPG